MEGFDRVRMALAGRSLGTKASGAPGRRSPIEQTTLSCRVLRMHAAACLGTGDTRDSSVAVKLDAK